MDLRRGYAVKAIFEAADFGLTGKAPRPLGLCLLPGDVRYSLQLCLISTAVVKLSLVQYDLNW